MSSVVQVVTGRSTSGTVSASITPNTPGNPILVMLQASSTTGGAFSLSSITDSNGTLTTGYAFATAATPNSDKAGIGIYFVQTSAAGAHSISATLSVAENATLILAEISTGGTPTLDVAGTLATGNSATPTTGSITPVNNGDLLVAVAMMISTGAAWNGTWTNGFTQGGTYTAAGPNCAFAIFDQTTAAAISTGTTYGQSNQWGAQIVALKVGASTVPTVTSVNTTNTVAEGSTAVPVVGTNFDNTVTVNILQPGGVSVAQTGVTYNSPTSLSFNLVVEPGSGSQLAFTDSTYTTDITVTTTSGGTSAPFAITVAPPAGLIFQTLSSINPTSPYRFTAIPDLAINDQVEGAGDSAGTTAAPPGLFFDGDGTFGFYAGYTPVDFYVRGYYGTNKVWGAWALQTVATPAVGIEGVSAPYVEDDLVAGGNNYEVSSPHVTRDTSVTRRLH